MNALPGQKAKSFISLCTLSVLDLRQMGANDGCCQDGGDFCDPCGRRHLLGWGKGEGFHGKHCGFETVTNDVSNAPKRIAKEGSAAQALLQIPVVVKSWTRTAGSTSASE